MTTISFEISEPSFVTLRIYNLLGQEVATLLNEFKEPERYEVRWDASNFASGIYTYRIYAGDPSSSSGQGFVETKKMILLR